jgi:hypothetical protein
LQPHNPHIYLHPNETNEPTAPSTEQLPPLSSGDCAAVSFMSGELLIDSFQVRVAMA